MRAALALTVLALALVIAPRPASACQIMCSHVWPAPGAVDVPVDVSLVVRGDGARLVLVGPDGVVPIRRTELSGPEDWSFLTPRRRLEPGVTYRLEQRSGDYRHVWTSFTTGDHRAPRRLRAPRILDTTFLYRLLPPPDRYCGLPMNRAAIAIDPQPGIGAYELSIQRGRDVHTEVVLDHDLANLAGACGPIALEPGVEYCLELRAIDASGARGPSATTCARAEVVPASAAFPAAVPPAEPATTPARLRSGSPILAARHVAALLVLALLAALAIGRRLARPRAGR